ncbi:serine/threonine protein kinase [Staphylospora marina]|uniref:serine/threonine protein kinase n=1 Tax=Staphylospora marina TaxID=2490858 RepID=UPI0013DE68D2|nr:serine/threonine protein kinase [Staphylospora marina]
MNHEQVRRHFAERWKNIAPPIQKIRIRTYPDNRRVSVGPLPPGYFLVGRGTDAAVIGTVHDPSIVFKIYGPDRLHKVREEAEVYRRLGDSPFFCRFLGQGEGFLVLSREKGPTFHECLEKGIPVPEQAMRDVEKAREHVRQCGLNPKGIHLRNILLVDGRAKVVDVAEFLGTGRDRRWDWLALGYRTVYPLIRGRAVPHWLLEAVKRVSRLNVHKLRRWNLKTGTERSR